MNRPTRWSYSSLSTYQQCPAKWKFSYIDNLPWPSSAAMTRGTRLHLMCEEYVNGKVQILHPDIAKVGRTLEDLKMKGAKTEETWLLRRDWTPTLDQNEAWIKAIIDVHYVEGDVLFVKDYKSGQMYQDHAKQLELYSLIGMCKFPEAKRVESSAIYIDQNYEGHHNAIIPLMKDKLIEPWDAAAHEMFNDTVLEPRPGNGCRWCPFAKDKGGPCEY